MADASQTDRKNVMAGFTITDGDELIDHNLGIVWNGVTKADVHRLQGLLKRPEVAKPYAEYITALGNAAFELGVTPSSTPGNV